MTDSWMGWEVELYADTGADAPTDPTDEEEIALAESVTFNVTRDTDAYHCLGEEDPHAILRGAKEISGTIDKLTTSSRFFDILDDDEDFWIYALVDDSGTDDVYVQIEGASISDYSLEIGEDEDVVESIDFEATSMDFENPSTGTTASTIRKAKKSNTTKTDESEESEDSEKEGE